MKAVKITNHKVSGCENRDKAVEHLQKIYGEDVEFDVINSQRFAEEGWTFWIDVIEKVGGKKLAKKAQSKD